jgi:hypothetical protein
MLLSAISGMSLQLGAGERGFSLSYSTNAWSPALNWLASATLFRIDREGHLLELRGAIERHIAQMGPAPDGNQVFPFFVPPEPALYQMELTFHDPQGNILGRYGEYFRVLKPSVHLRLRQTRTVLRPGDSFKTRIENPGVAFVAAKRLVPLERKEGASWVAVPEFPPAKGPAIGIYLKPGETSCWATRRIPVDAPPGVYRLVVGSEVTLNATRPARNRDLVAKFRVKPR